MEEQRGPAGSPNEQVQRLLEQVAQGQAALEALAAHGVDAVLSPRTQRLLLLEQAQAALQESQARYDRLVQRLAAVVFEMDAGGTVTFVNRAVTAMLGYEQQEVLGKNLWQWFPPQVAARLRSLLAKGDISAYPLAVVAKDGSERILELNSANHYSPGGELQSIAGIAVDITERKRAERALQEAHATLERRVRERTAELEAANAALAEERERLNVTLRSIGDGVIVTDADLRVTLMNPVGESLTGWPEPEARGRELDEVLPLLEEGNGLPVAAPARDCLRLGRPVHLARQVYLRARDGSRHLVSDSAAPIASEAGQLLFHSQTTPYR